MDTCSIEECENERYCRGWCRAHYKRWERLGDPLSGKQKLRRPKRTVIERFEEFIPERPLDGCWLWRGAVVTSTGYGAFRIDRRSVSAHRFAYEHFIGPIPDGLHIDHVQSLGCTNRHCVNPAHLEAVTQAENNRRNPSRRKK